jgi:hypothetical protein
MTGRIVSLFRNLFRKDAVDRALDDVLQTGVSRVLTSGGEQNAEDGIANIARLVAAANNSVAVMVGGGIRETNVSRILAETSAHDIHANVGHSVASPMMYRNNKISLGAVKGSEYQRVVVLEDRVRRLVDAASAAQGCRRTQPTGKGLPTLDSKRQGRCFSTHGRVVTLAEPAFHPTTWQQVLKRWSPAPD